MTPTYHVVLTGPMAVGKTTVGKMVASQLGYTFIDSDEILEARHGATARQIAADRGVRYLHRIEADLVTTTVAGTAPCVVAAAASIGDRPDLLGAIIAGGHSLILLAGDPVELAARSGNDRHRRALAPREAGRLAEAREELIRGVGGIVVDTRRLSAAETAGVVVELVLSGPAREIGSTR